MPGGSVSAAPRFLEPSDSGSRPEFHFPSMESMKKKRASCRVSKRAESKTFDSARGRSRRWHDAAGVGVGALRDRAVLAARTAVRVRK